ncbi:hypothetical protein HS327_01265 [Glaesserella parasuis]|nr:hypothetical protein HS327_01265 [Glaesserella parasuis]
MSPGFASVGKSITTAPVPGTVLNCGADGAVVSPVWSAAVLPTAGTVGVSALSTPLDSALVSLPSALAVTLKVSFADTSKPLRSVIATSNFLSFTTAVKA